MNRSMTPPNEELARRILSPVPYRDRFPAGRLKPPVGIMPGDVRSLPELHGFLAPDERTLPGVNLGKLPAWVERAIGDRELAERLAEDVATAGTYVEGCLRVRELVGQRIEQAREAAQPWIA
jgi:hypothetical protein